MSTQDASALPEALPPLNLPSDRWEAIQTPFEGDVLSREQLARQLTGYLERLRDGAVISLDAPWGEGKTWFARHWAAELLANGFRVGCIDAFENDYVEDPFLLLAAEVRRLSAADQSRAARLGSKAAQVGKALMPMATKLTINLVGKAIGTTDLGDAWEEQLDKVREKGADAAQAWVKRRIELHDKERDSMRAFHQELAAFAKGADDQPVVIIIDELDRCRPAFAVKLLERIKHFFDAPNLVFVLVMNRDQLEKAIRGVYGAETNAAAYLGKFLHLSLRLPKVRTLTIDETHNQLQRFVGKTLERFRYEDPHDQLLLPMTVSAVALDLSLREIERACALYFLGQQPWHGLMSFLAALKIKHPDIFEGMRVEDGLQREACYKLVMRARGRSIYDRQSDWATSYLRAVAVLLRTPGIDVASDTEWLSGQLPLLFSDERPNDFQAALKQALRRLDLDVQ